MTEVKSFLDLAGYYQRFAQGFSSIASSLTRLTRKDKKYIRTTECASSFQELKMRLTSVPVLALPSGSDGYVIYSDASLKGVGCVLMQHCRVITYVSCQLKAHEQN